MSYEMRGEEIDYLPCRYGKSKLMFRGPRRKLDGNHVAFLGGTETYGKYMPQPFPAMVEEATGLTCVNFGWQNAGADVFLNDRTVLEACSGARATVIQVLGAQNMSNRFYSVHPRRNDRFLKASSLMKTIYRDVDFTEFHFTRHMLQVLQDVSRDRFAVIEEELKAAWTARMQILLKKIEGKTILLWLSDRSPDDDNDNPLAASEPLFVDREMIEALRPNATEVIEVQVSPGALVNRTEGMLFPELEAQAAADLLGAKAHREAADAVIGSLGNVVPLRGI